MQGGGFWVTIVMFFSVLTIIFVAGIQYMKSRRGKIIMMVNTFPFCEESKLRDKVIWRCTSKKTNCKARIHMLGKNVVAVKGMHNHPPRIISSWCLFNYYIDNFYVLLRLFGNFISNIYIFLQEMCPMTKKWIFLKCYESAYFVYSIYF